MPVIDRERVSAFRLANHYPTERPRPRSVVQAAAACGIQETPTGSAAVALAARVDRLTPAPLWPPTGLVADAAARRKLWQPVSGPGAV